MAAKRSMWSKAGKFVSAVVILCFFLPFFGVSCDGMDVITISGADMVGGCKPGGLITAAEEDGKMQGGKLETKIENVSVEPFAIGALVLVLAMFGLSFVTSRKALQGTLVAAVLAAGLLVALFVKMKGEMMDAVDKESASMSKNRMMSDTKISAGGRMGLWLVGFGLLSVIGMTASAMRKQPEVTPEIVPPPSAPTVQS